MASLLVATHNAGKLKEIAKLLQDVSINVVNAAQFNIPEPEETGATFAANAILKAEHALLFAPNHYVLADDSGLEVDVLGGAPGIYSARWGGANKDFNLAMQKVHDEIVQTGANPQNQSARFICTLALAKHGEATICFEGTIEGSLTFPPRGENGFGYDPIFIANNYDITFAQMDATEKQLISHRTQAFKKLARHLSSKLSNFY
jgi:XTP/dITP diphosphohydrolase